METVASVNVSSGVEDEWCRLCAAACADPGNGNEVIGIEFWLV